MFVYCDCCVSSSRSLCDEPIISPEESYRLWWVVACDLETSRMRRPWHELGRRAMVRRGVEKGGGGNLHNKRGKQILLFIVYPPTCIDYL